MARTNTRKSAQVIDLFSRSPIHTPSPNRIIRLSPETDGLGMLYGNDSNPGKLFSMKIAAWGLKENGEIVGLVPWLNSVTPCPDLTDPLNGHWEGYYNISTGDIFYEAPSHKQKELEAAVEYFGESPHQESTLIQEIPDTIGTHAVLTDHDNKRFKIVSVFSWQLDVSGKISGMLIDKDKVKRTPVLTGDDCLYPAENDPKFKYFFQYRIANKIKDKDPEAMEAIALLMDF